MGIREDLLIECEAKRDAAMKQADKVAKLIVAMLIAVQEPKTFVAMDLDNVSRAVDRLRALQRQVIEADRGYRQHLAEA